MALWTSKEIEAATNGIASAEFKVDGVAFDSREVGPEDLFFALKGEQSDGHHYVRKALEQGCAGAVVSEPIDGPHILVKETTAALYDLAKASRKRSAAKIVGVTGSVGKTGTKEALFAAVDRTSFGTAHRSVKSYNNHVGVPLSLIRMPRDAAFGIFEMGMNHPGELTELTALVRPDVALITTIAPAHAGFFRDVEQIADAKAEIFSGLTVDGTAILPFDSPHFLRLKKAALCYTDNIVSFGLRDGADVRAIDIVPAVGGGSLVTAKLGNQSLCFTISEPGKHWVSNAMAVLAAVHAMDVDLAIAGIALAELQGLVGRGKRHNIAASDNGKALLIDESYNANPGSMTATLAQLSQERCAGKKIAILGAMGELGDKSKQYHEALADDITASGASLLILVGDEMAHTFAKLERKCDEALEAAPKIFHVAGSSDALGIVQPEINDGDVILVKGSNYLGLAKLVSVLTETSASRKK